MNLIQFKQVQGLENRFLSGDAAQSTLSGYLDSEIWYLMTGNNTFTGNKIFKDSVTFLEAVTGVSSGNFQNGLWVGVDQVITEADTGVFMDLTNDQDVTGVKTFQGGAVNTIHQGGTVYIKQWGIVSEPTVALRITGELWITGSEGSAIQITNDSKWISGDLPTDIYYATPGGAVGIGTLTPQYSLDVHGTGAFATVKSTGTNQNLFDSPIGIGTGASNFTSHFSTWGSDDVYPVTGAEFINESAAEGSSAEIRMVCDPSLGAGDYGAVNLGSRREEDTLVSSFIVKTKTGVSYTEGFDTRFQISGSRIIVDYNGTAAADPLHKGELWISGGSYLMVSAG